MKSIIILNESFNYKIEDVEGYYGETGWITCFYKGSTIETSRKYIFFGEKITKIVPKQVFSVGFDIETSTQYTKEELKEILERKVKLFHRNEELKRGELI